MQRRQLPCACPLTTVTPFDIAFEQNAVHKYGRSGSAQIFQGGEKAAGFPVGKRFRQHDWYEQSLAALAQHA